MVQNGVRHPPSRVPGRSAYWIVNQAKKCRNCGFGLGQFGVEFQGAYCSLDCFTSAKVRVREIADTPAFCDDERNARAIHITRARERERERERERTERVGVAWNTGYPLRSGWGSYIFCGVLGFGLNDTRSRSILSRSVN